MATQLQLRALAADNAPMVAKRLTDPELDTFARQWLKRFEQTPPKRVAEGLRRWRDEAAGQPQTLPTAETLARHVAVTDAPRPKRRGGQWNKPKRGVLESFLQVAHGALAGEDPGAALEELEAATKATEVSSGARAGCGCSGSGVVTGPVLTVEGRGYTTALPCRACNPSSFARWQATFDGENRPVVL